VSPDAAGPPDQGFRIRVHHLVKGLAAADLDVTLLAIAPDGTWERDALDGVHVITVPSTRPRTISDRARIRRAAALLAGRRVGSLHARAKDLRPKLHAIGGEYDAIQVEIPGLVRDAQHLGRPVIYDAHNIWSELARRGARIRHSRFRRTIGSIYARAVRSVEVDAWQRADLSLATSLRDASIIGSATGHVEVIPNGVDLDAYRPPEGAGASDDVPDGGVQVVFVGLLAYGPNGNAARELIEDIMPRVERLIPGVELTIVGDKAPPALLALARANVTFTGRVDDVRPIVGRAGAVAVPLRVGSGTRLKILEALAMARPVVTTSLGAEGLPLVDGTHALIADDPEDFSDALIRVLDDPDLAQRLGQNGRELVEASFGWRSIGEQLAKHYQHLLAAKA
jgi:glycosyltransferase involved in cell wall biosynthesis